MNKTGFLPKIASIAGIALAVALFNLSCSNEPDDVVKKKKTTDSSYPSCSQLSGIMDECEGLSEAAMEACEAQFDIDDDLDEYSDCILKAYGVVEKCLIEEACNGNSLDACYEHLERCFDEGGNSSSSGGNNGNSSPSSGGYPICSVFNIIIEECSELEPSEAAMEACEAQLDIDEDLDEYSDCITAAYQQVIQDCIINEACNGNSLDACQEYFEKECDF